MSVPCNTPAQSADKLLTGEKQDTKKRGGELGGIPSDLYATKLLLKIDDVTVQSQASMNIVKRVWARIPCEYPKS